MKRGARRLVAGLLITSFSAFSQVNPLVIEWQQSFGGFGSEMACVARPMGGGGYLVAGSSSSTLGGNKTSASYGNQDFWSVRINSIGEIVWQRSDGGSISELSSDALVLPNGDVLRVGISDSSAFTGNKTNANNGLLADPWLVRIDGNGNKLWDRAVGTVYLDLTPAISATSDGGFILAAQPKPRAPRDYDFQVWRLAANGTEIWNRAYGGLGHDLTTTVQQTSDGGYVVGGDSNSGVGGHKTAASAGGYDFWVLRLDADGNVLWDRTYGGEGEDRLRDVRQTADGGFILAGSSRSPVSGNKASASFGSNDFWIVRIDATGNKLWDRAYGGTRDDGLGDIDLLSDGGLVAAGYSASDADGSKTAPPLGAWDGWLVRLDANGNQLWDQSLGGSNLEGISSVRGKQPTAVSSSALTHFPGRMETRQQRTLGTLTSGSSSLGQKGLGSIGNRITRNGTWCCAACLTGPTALRFRQTCWTGRRSAQTRPTPRG